MSAVHAPRAVPRQSATRPASLRPRGRATCLLSGVPLPRSFARRHRHPALRPLPRRWQVHPQGWPRWHAVPRLVPVHRTGADGLFHQRAVRSTGRSRCRLRRCGRVPVPRGPRQGCHAPLSRWREDVHCLLMPWPARLPANQGAGAGGYVRHRCHAPRRAAQTRPSATTRPAAWSPPVPGSGCPAGTGPRRCYRQCRCQPMPLSVQGPLTRTRQAGGSFRVVTDLLARRRHASSLPRQRRLVTPVRRQDRRSMPVPCRLIPSACRQWAHPRCPPLLPADIQGRQFQPAAVSI